MNKQQKGFTLLELMIAMLLGLIIVAAGTAIFLNAQRSMGMQIGVGEVQQNANFGLSFLTYDLRHTNLNMPTGQTINYKTVGSGIIFNVANLPSSLSDTSTDLLSKQNNDEDATTGKSDQITIQFIPQYIDTSTTPVSEDGVTKQPTTISSNARMYNCEGNEIIFSSDNSDNLDVETVPLKPTIVQRYFVKALPQSEQEQSANAFKRYGLYCDYGYYTADDSTITGLGEGELLIMRDIDAFRVQLAVQDPSKEMRYLTMDEYIALMPSKDAENAASAPVYNVMSLEVGLLVRANSKVNSAELSSKKKFLLAGTSVELDTAKTSTGYLRQVIGQVVGLRNTLGAL